MADWTENITSEELGVSTEDLAAYANRDSDDFAAGCLDEALALVEQYVTGCTVPVSIGRRAVLEVGSNLLRRNQRMDGLSAYDTSELEPLRVTRDPLQAARALLAPYVSPGVF